MKQLIIYGAGGFAREVAWLAEDCNDALGGIEVVGFVDVAPERYGVLLNGIPIMSEEEAHEKFPQALAVSGLGAPRLREIVMEKAAVVGFSMLSLIHPGVQRSRYIEIGEGAVICAGNILTTNITLGRHVQINLDCTIGHDAILEDYVTVAPGAHISGWVHIRKGAYIGTGASIINGTEESPLVIGEGAVVGAGACVTKSVAPGKTVVGVPARPLGN